MRIKSDKQLSDGELYALAKKASKSAYCPYSDFAVGAALECDTGYIYLGANIENASYPVTLCAERAALSYAVLNGERKIMRLAVYGKKRGGDGETVCYPCGMCRQAISEFADENLTVITGEENPTENNLFSSLLPYSFGKENLK